MLDPAILDRYTDAQLLHLISNLETMTSILEADPQSNGQRWKVLCQQELQRRLNRQRSLKARVEEVR